MNRVIFNHKSGRKELMELRYAKILQGLKRGTYMTRDMSADRETAAPVEPQYVIDKKPAKKPAKKNTKAVK